MGRELFCVFDASREVSVEFNHFGAYEVRTCGLWLKTSPKLAPTLHKNSTDDLAPLFALMLSIKTSQLSII